MRAEGGDSGLKSVFIRVYWFFLRAFAANLPTVIFRLTCPV
jgi:hypothetical protein